TVGIAVSVVVLAAARQPDTAAAPTSRNARVNAPRDDVQWIQMRDVDLHIDEEHVMRVRSLQGRVTPSDSNSIAILDDPKSFRIRVTSGTVDLAGPDLAALLNEYVFNYRGSPLRDLRARTDGTQLVLGGIMHKGVDIPFEITSELSLDPDGRIRS